MCVAQPEIVRVKTLWKPTRTRALQFLVWFPLCCSSFHKTYAIGRQMWKTNVTVKQSLDKIEQLFMWKLYSHSTDEHDHELPMNTTLNTLVKRGGDGCGGGDRKSTGASTHQKQIRNERQTQNSTENSLLGPCLMRVWGLPPAKSLTQRAYNSSGNPRQHINLIGMLSTFTCVVACVLLHAHCCMRVVACELMQSEMSYLCLCNVCYIHAHMLPVCLYAFRIYIYIYIEREREIDR